MRSGEIWMLSAVLLCSTEMDIGASEFELSPQVQKYDPGDTASFMWTLTQDFDKSRTFAKMSIYKGIFTITSDPIVEYTEAFRVCSNFGDQRLACIVPETVGKTIGFNITNITNSDADKYICEVNFGSSTSIDSNATLYVFDAPLVTIRRGASVSVGSPVTLTCSATSKSQPAGVVTPDLVYNWTINNPAGNHYMQGENVVKIDSAVSANDGATFKCSVREFGSSLTNESTVYLTVTAATTAGPSTARPTTADSGGVDTRLAVIIGASVGGVLVLTFIIVVPTTTTSTTTASTTPATTSSLTTCRDPCGLSPCQNGGTCVPDGCLYRCNCTHNYQGDTCRTSGCDVGPSVGGCTCYNGGSCIDRPDSCVCSCPSCYSGNSCDRYIGNKTACTTNPCGFPVRGTCSVDCNLPDHYSCLCNVNYQGWNCTESCSLINATQRFHQVTLGSSLTLWCNSSEYTDLRWTPFGNTKKTLNSSRGLTSSLHFPEVYKANATQYSCCVTSQCTQCVTYTVRTTVSWALSSNLSSGPVRSGDTVEVSCDVSGSPEPLVQWWYYRDVQTEGDVTTSNPQDAVIYVNNATSGNATLQISDVTQEDVRTYYCWVFYLDFNITQFAAYNLSLLPDKEEQRNLLLYVVPQPCLEAAVTVAIIVLVYCCVYAKGLVSTAFGLWLLLLLLGVLPVAFIAAVTLGVSSDVYQGTPDWTVILAVNLTSALVFVAAILTFGIIVLKHLPWHKTKGDKRTGKAKTDPAVKDTSLEVKQPLPDIKTTASSEQPQSLSAGPAGVPLQHAKSPRHLPPLTEGAHRALPPIINNKVSPEHSPEKHQANPQV